MDLWPPSGVPFPGTVDFVDGAVEQELPLSSEGFQLVPRNDCASPILSINGKVQGLLIYFDKTIKDFNGSAPGTRVNIGGS